MIREENWSDNRGKTLQSEVLEDLNLHKIEVEAWKTVLPSKAYNIPTGSPTQEKRKKKKKKQKKAPLGKGRKALDNLGWNTKQIIPSLKLLTGQLLYQQMVQLAESRTSWLH